MIDSTQTDHLVEIALDPELRHSVYEHMGEFCHQCRNRLNSLKLCIYLAKRQPSVVQGPHFAALEGHYALLEKSIEQIQILCRPMTISIAQLSMDLLIQDRLPKWRQLAADHDIEFLCHPGTEARASSFDPDQLGQSLDWLVNWRLSRLGPGATIQFRWAVDASQSWIRWEETQDAFANHRGVKGAVSEWFLPLISRVIQAHGGEVQVYDQDNWAIEMRWAHLSGPGKIVR